MIKCTPPTAIFLPLSHWCYTNALHILAIHHDGFHKFDAIQMDVILWRFTTMASIKLTIRECLAHFGYPPWWLSWNLCYTNVLHVLAIHHDGFIKINATQMVCIGYLPQWLPCNWRYANGLHHLAIHHDGFHKFDATRMSCIFWASTMMASIKLMLQKWFAWFGYPPWWLP